jgi:hypothetical protein
MQNNSQGTESKSLYENARANCIYYKTSFSMARSSIFDSYDPLIKTEPVFVIENMNIQERLLVRPVWIIGDLKTLHNWMNSPLRKSNWFIDTGKKSLFRHYKETSLAGDSQSFMIEHNQIPIIQFDIMPNPVKKWRNKRLKHGDDCLVNFLFAENFRMPGLFQTGFECLAECLRSLTGIRFIYVPILQSDKYMDTQMTTIGFESRRFSTFYGKGNWLYRFEIGK